MENVTIYSLTHCPYCVRAKDLLSRNGITFKEIIADELPRDEVEKLFARSGMRTFPQIFISDKILGGFSELKELDDSVGLKSHLK